MDNDRNDNALAVPYIVHESAEARHERRERRLLCALLIAVIFLFASNALWLYAWTLYDYGYEDYAVSVDADEGNANFIGQDGDIVYGADNGAESAAD